jgi:hypothetical protein
MNKNKNKIIKDNNKIQMLILTFLEVISFIIQIIKLNPLLLLKIIFRTKIS